MLCPPSRYGDSYGLFTSNCTDICPIGSYCGPNAGTIHPVLCPSGRYGSSLNQSQSTCDGLCEKGHWCQAGSISSKQNKCKGGIAGLTEGLQTASCSNNCEPSINGKAPNYCVINQCKEGYACAEGSISITQQECGSANVYCATGSAIPTPVSEGYYTIGPFSVQYQQQVSFDETTRTHQVLCEPGFWCSQGIRYACNHGTYGSTYGLTTSKCSGLCEGGFICNYSSNTAQERNCGLDSSVYCPIGSYQSLLVPAGYYAVNGTYTTRSAILHCEPGTVSH